MPWYAWAVIIYEALSAVLTVYWIDRTILITRGVAITTLVLTGLCIWAIVALAGLA